MNEEVKLRIAFLFDTYDRTALSDWLNLSVLVRCFACHKWQICIEHHQSTQRVSRAEFPSGNTGYGHAALVWRSRLHHLVGYHCRAALARSDTLYCRITHRSHTGWLLQTKAAHAHTHALGTPTHTCRLYIRLLAGPSPFVLSRATANVPVDPALRVIVWMIVRRDHYVIRLLLRCQILPGLRNRPLFCNRSSLSFVLLHCRWGPVSLNLWF